MCARTKFFPCLIVVGLAVMTWALPSFANYYDGKTITIIMGGNPGSGLDLNARFFANNWEKHFPGKTQLIVKNMPGAGGDKALNHIYKRGRPDGLTIYYGGWNPTGILTGQPGIRYKIGELKSVGAANGFFVSLVHSDVAATPKDILSAKNLKVGGINPSFGTDNVSQMTLDLLGVDFRYISGYRGMPKVKTALLSGEINFTTTGYAGYKNFFKETSLKSGQLIMAWHHASFDQDGNPIETNSFPGVKSFMEVYQELRGGQPSGPLFEAYQYITNLSFKMINNVIAPANIPAAALEDLRKTFKATYEDPEFQEQWKKRYGTEFIWMDGETGQKLFDSFDDGISPAVIEVLKKYKTKGLR